MKVNAKSKGWQSWRCLHAAAAQAGFRKDEVCAKSKKEGFTKVQFSRASLCFCVKGKYVRDPSTEELELMLVSDDCSVLLEPHPSKADQDGAFWCDKPIYFPVRRSDPVSAAVEIIRLELLDPCHGDKRIDTPLFMNNDRSPFTKAQVDAGMKDMIKEVIPADQCSKYSFHSYRIWLACSLDRAGCPPSKIKRILRWISDEALNTYVRDGENMYCKWLDAAAHSTVQTVQSWNLPELEAILQYVDCPEEVAEDSDFEE